MMVIYNLKELNINFYIKSIDHAFQNLTTNRIRFINNNTNSYITHEKSHLNRCFIQEINNDKTLINNEFNTNINKEDNEHVINISDIDPYINPNKSLIYFLNNDNNKFSEKILKKEGNDQKILLNNYSNLNNEIHFNANKNFKLIANNNSVLENNSVTNTNNISISDINSVNNNNYNTQNNNYNLNIGLPNIENFFIIKDKVFLVDDEKTVWHLKKCKRFDKIQNEFLENIRFETKNLNIIEFNKNNNKNISTANESNKNILSNYKNQIFNNFLEFYQNPQTEIEINSNLRENESNILLINENNEIKSSKNMEIINTDCKSSGFSEQKILNVSNISKQIIFSNNCNSIHKKILESKFIKSNDNNNNNNNLKVNSKMRIFKNKNFIENEQNITKEEFNEDEKDLENQSNHMNNEKMIEIQNKNFNNYGNPDNTITSMDLVSDYSRKLIKDCYENSQILRHVEDTKDEKLENQELILKERFEYNNENERPIKNTYKENDKRNKL